MQTGSRRGREKAKILNIYVKMKIQNTPEIVSKRMMHWSVLFVLGLTILFIILVKNPNYFSSNVGNTAAVVLANGPTLSLSPSSATVVPGQIFSVTINMDTAATPIEGVDIYSLHFNPAVLQVVDDDPVTPGVQIGAGNMLPQKIWNNVDQLNGVVQYSESILQGTSVYQGSGVLVTIHFQAIAVGSSLLSFDFISGSTIDTNIVYLSSDRLSSVGSSVVNVVATAPTVAISEPLASSTLSGNINITAVASSSSSVVGMQFKIDGVNLGVEDTTSPYSMMWDTTTATNTVHVISAVGRDTEGNLVLAPDVLVTVSNVVVPPPAPTVSPEGVMVPPATKIIDASLNVWTLSTDTPYAKFLRNNVHMGGGYGTTILWSGGKIYVIGDDTQTQWYVWTGTSWSYYGTNKPPAPDTTPPTVSFTAPINNSTTTGTVTVSASATDASGIAGVQFKLDNVSLSVEDTTSPYSVSWNTAATSNGTHLLTAVARDKSNNFATSTRTVNVANPVVLPARISIVPPTLNFTSVSGGALPAAQTITLTNTGGKTLSWSGSTNQTWCKTTPASGSIAAGANTKLTVSVTSLVSIGTFNCVLSISAALSDNSPQTAAVTYSVTADISMPTTSITAPVNGGTVSKNKSTTISASASDNVGVTKILFYVAGALLCTDTSAPYTCAWSVPSTVNKTYTIQSKAYDAAGNIGSSTVIMVTGK